MKGTNPSSALAWPYKNCMPPVPAPHLPFPSGL